MNRFHFTLLMMLQFLPSLSAQDSVSTNEELNGIIKAAVASVGSIDPIDLFAHYHKSDVFNQVVEGTTEVRFRMFLSRSQQRLVWACETRNGLANRASVVGNVLVNGSVIQNDKLSITSGTTVEVFNKPFDDLMRDVRIPHPAYWGLIDFPNFDNNAKSLEKVLTSAFQDGSTSSIANTKDGLRCRLARRHASGLLDTFTWEISLPNMHPVSVRLDRERDVHKHRVFEHELIWEEIRGRQRPVMLVGSAQAVKKTEKGNFVLGRSHYDMEIKWLTGTGKDKFESFPNPTAVMKFLTAKQPGKNSQSRQARDD